VGSDSLSACFFSLLPAAKAPTPKAIAAAAVAVAVSGETVAPVDASSVAETPDAVAGVLAATTLAPSTPDDCVAPVG
jgi:hypothetical protein